MTGANFLQVSTHAYACLLFLLSVLLLLLWLDSSSQHLEVSEVGQGPGRRLVCYYTFNATDLVPELIDPTLCTHINLGFAAIDPSNCSVYLSPQQHEVLSRVVGITRPRQVTTLISVGGAGMSQFGHMVANHANRKLFLRSLMGLLKQYGLDGVDLDWEWPVIDGGARQKVQFIQLLQEIRGEFNRHEKKYVLSAAVAAVESIVQASYYVQHMAEHVDFVNVMSYDYHFFTTFYPVTDFNAPLFSPPGGALADFNANSTINLWLSLGMPRDKLVLGLPAFGHTYRLANAANHGLRAPATGFGFGSDGFVSYQEVCTFIQSSPYVSVMRDPTAKVPYAYHLHDWVSYDDGYSLAEKVVLANELNLGGVMFYSLNADDYRGICSDGLKYPLLTAVRAALLHLR